MNEKSVFFNKKFYLDRVLPSQIKLSFSYCHWNSNNYIGYTTSKPETSAATMADGKKFLLTLSIILFYVCKCCNSTRSPSMLKGGLVYSEESHQGPVYLNQNYYTFARKTNTTTLATAARLCRDLTSLYKLWCADIAISAQRFNIKLNQTLEESVALREPVAIKSMVF